MPSELMMVSTSPAGPRPAPYATSYGMLESHTPWKSMMGRGVAGGAPNPRRGEADTTPTEARGRLGVGGGRCVHLE